MKRHPGFALFVLAACLAAASTVPQAVENPHVSMDACLACHVSVPSLEDAQALEYRLRNGTIDETCRGCHANITCALGLGKVVHPSGIDEWDPRICDGPRTLPLHEGGKITCSTCHYRLRPVGEDYKMVRRAAFHDGHVELVAFCMDCHEDYY